MLLLRWKSSLAKSLLIWRFFGAPLVQVFPPRCQMPAVAKPTMIWLALRFVLMGLPLFLRKTTSAVITPEYLFAVAALPNTACHVDLLSICSVIASMRQSFFPTFLFNICSCRHSSINFMYCLLVPLNQLLHPVDMPTGELLQ